MKQKSGPDKAPAEQVVKDIRRQTRRQYSAEEKIRIVLEGLRGEENISELCRREGIAASMYYGWSKEFLEAGKRRLAGDTARNSKNALAVLPKSMGASRPFGRAIGSSNSRPKPARDDYLAPPPARNVISHLVRSHAYIAFLVLSD